MTIRTQMCRRRESFDGFTERVNGFDKLRLRHHRGERTRIIESGGAVRATRAQIIKSAIFLFDGSFIIVSASPWKKSVSVLKPIPDTTPTR